MFTVTRLGHKILYVVCTVIENYWVTRKIAGENFAIFSILHIKYKLTFFTCRHHLCNLQKLWQRKNKNKTKVFETESNHYKNQTIVLGILKILMSKFLGIYKNNNVQVLSLKYIHVYWEQDYFSFHRIVKFK